MGWSFKWLSSFGSDFNYDYFASFTPDEVKNGATFWNYERQKSDAGEDVVLEEGVRFLSARQPGERAAPAAEWAPARTPRPGALALPPP